MNRIKLLLAVAALVASAGSARAQSCNVDQIIANCDAAFSADHLLTYSARGWCYLVNLSTCPVT